MTILRGSIKICQDCAYQNPVKKGKKRIDYHCLIANTKCTNAVNTCTFQDTLNDIHSKMCASEILRQGIKIETESNFNSLKK
jgi:hypothetical protein